MPPIPSTLHASIAERVREFETERRNLGKMTAELERIRALLEHMDSDPRRTSGDPEFMEHRMGLADRRAELEKRIADVQSESRETEYWLDCIPYMREYEAAAPTGAAAAQPPTTFHAEDPAAAATSSTDEDDDRAMRPAAPKRRPVKRRPPVRPQPPAPRNTVLDGLVERRAVARHGKVFDRYREKVEGQGAAPVLHSDPNLWCRACSKARLFNQAEGAMVCPECGDVCELLMQTAAQCPYGWQPPRRMSSFAYKRASHLAERLNQLQARENFDIPEDVFVKVYAELKKIRKLDDVRPDLIRSVLKKLKLSKLYEHIGIIYSRLTGAPPPQLTEAQEARIKSMFAEIQGPFDKACPAKRKNFLSYSFVLHKICQLLGLDHLLPYFPLLKSAEKLHQQDVIWRQICGELGWQFIKSV